MLTISRKQLIRLRAERLPINTAGRYIKPPALPAEAKQQYRFSRQAADRSIARIATDQDRAEISAVEIGADVHNIELAIKNNHKLL